MQQEGVIDTNILPRAEEELECELEWLTEGPLGAAHVAGQGPGQPVEGSESDFRAGRGPV